MSIQAKFALLLGLLGLTVIVSLGTAYWSFGLLHREITQRFDNIAGVMKGLAETKRAVEAQREALRELDPALDDTREPGAPDPAGSAPEDASDLKARFRTHHDAMLHGLRGLESMADRYVVQVGESTSRNLRGRADAYSLDAARWLDAPDPALARRLLTLLFDLHELIERIESKILVGARFDVQYADTIKARLTRVLALSFLSAALAGTLGFFLVRRWISRPVEALRAAAAKIGAGDFTHRIAVAGGRRDEIALLGSEVNHMAEMVADMQEERVERERLAAVGEMVRRLAHNLRNPLSGIRGLAEISRADLPAGSDVREAQDRIIRTVDRFEKWLKELLDATKPLAVQPVPGPVRPWLTGLVETLRPQAETKGVTVDLDASRAPERAVFDSRHLEHAIVAILSNAIEATPSGGRVLVGVGPEQSANQADLAATWVVRIEDQGPGVPAELRERIFKPYFTTKKDGNGIGLAVAQQVVRSHGGRITVESGSESGTALQEPSAGAAFVVRLPLAGPGTGEMAGSGQVGDTVGQNSRH